MALASLTERPALVTPPAKSRQGPWKLIGGPLPQVPQTEEGAGETPG
jgi:hypothetical protein